MYPYGIDKGDIWLISDRGVYRMGITASRRRSARPRRGEVYGASEAAAPGARGSKPSRDREWIDGHGAVATCGSRDQRLVRAGRACKFCPDE